MAFTDEEKRRWLEARRLGIDYADADDDDYFDDVVSTQGDEAEDSEELGAVEDYSHCIHCGTAITGGALCAACE